MTEKDIYLDTAFYKPVMSITEKDMIGYLFARQKCEQFNKYGPS
jgi:hypothetical protein